MERLFPKLERIPAARAAAAAGAALQPPAQPSRRAVLTRPSRKLRPELGIFGPTIRTELDSTSSEPATGATAGLSSSEERQSTQDTSEQASSGTQNILPLRSEIKAPWAPPHHTAWHGRQSLRTALGLKMISPSDWTQSPAHRLARRAQDDARRLATQVLARHGNVPGATLAFISAEGDGGAARAVHSIAVALADRLASQVLLVLGAVDHYPVAAGFPWQQILAGDRHQLRIATDPAAPALRVIHLPQPLVGASDGEQLAALWQRLRSMASMVLIDATGAPGEDAAIAQSADAAYLLSRTGRQSKQLAREAINRLHAAGITPEGLIALGPMLLGEI